MRASLVFSPVLQAGLVLSLCSCGNRLAPAHPTKAPQPVAAKTHDAPRPIPKPGKSPELSSLFPSRERGWAAVEERERASIETFASDYMDFLKRARTQAESARELVAMAKTAGATPFDGSGKHKAGELLLWQDSAQSSVALLKIGSLPVAEGLRIIVASTDAAMIRLTPAPTYEKSGLALFDTTILGKLKLESWLNTPLVLDISVAGTRGEQAKAIRIGDQANEPVFTIPDLLPHLSRKVQRDGLIDTPERLDALAAFSVRALAKGLKSYGMSPSDWNRSEALLLPAQQASFIGVDRALMSAFNHSARAFPFAAVRATLQAKSRYTTLVVLLGHNKRSYAGADAEALVVNLVPMAIAQQQDKVDALDLRRIYARSKVMLYDNESGTRNEGLVLNARKDDSTPEAFRQILQNLEEAKVQYQIVNESGWSKAREISSHDMDAVEVGLPITGSGTPSALLSTLDLYQAFVACEAWVNQ